jgi:hypothetical protein
LRGLLDALEDALDARCRQMDADLRGKLRTIHTAPQPYYPANLAASTDAAIFYLDTVAPALARVQTAAGDDPDRLSRAKSRCADVLALLALGWEWSGRFEQSERTLLQALELADGAGARAEIQKNLDRVRPLAEQERAARARRGEPAPDPGREVDGGLETWVWEGNTRVRVRATAPQPAAQAKRRPRDRASVRRLVAVSIILGVAASVILSLFSKSGNSVQPGYNPAPPETSAESSREPDASGAAATDGEEAIAPPGPRDGTGANDVGEVNREP